MSGWIKIHRDINQHWIWQDSNYLKWWLDILLEVNHTECEIVIKGTILKCGRGEKLYSLDTWANRWNTNKSKVNRFLKMLEKQNMISLKNETHTTRLKVCKYEDYQEQSIKSETQVKHKRNTNETQVKSIQEEKEYKEEYSLVGSSQTPTKRDSKKDLFKTKLGEVDYDSLDEKQKKYFKIAVGFNKLFKETKIKLGINNFKDQEEATYGGYVEPIRLAIEKDNWTEEDFRTIFAFLRKDEFWSTVVFSTSKLREKMKDMMPKAKSSKLIKKQVLPKDFWYRELTDEQKKLLSPENLKHWERQKSAMQLEGGRLLPVKIVYEGYEQ